MKIIYLVVALLMNSTLRAAFVTHDVGIQFKAMRIFQGTIPEVIVSAEGIPEDTLPEGDYKNSMDLLMKGDPLAIPKDENPELGSEANFLNDNLNKKIDKTQEVQNNSPKYGKIMFMDDEFTENKVKNLQNSKILLNIDKFVIIQRITTEYKKIVFNDIWEKAGVYEAAFKENATLLHVSRDISDMNSTTRVFSIPFQLPSLADQNVIVNFYVLILLDLQIHARLKSNLLVV